MGVQVHERKEKRSNKKVGKQRKSRERETPTRENRTPACPHAPWTEAKSWHQPESSPPSARKSRSSTAALPTATIAAKHIGNIRPIRADKVHVWPLTRLGASDLYYLAVCGWQLSRLAESVDAMKVLLFVAVVTQDLPLLIVNTNAQIYWCTCLKWQLVETTIVATHHLTGSEYPPYTIANECTLQLYSHYPAVWLVISCGENDPSLPVR